MAEWDRDDDAEHLDVVRRAERANRIGWTAIAGTVGTLGCAAAALVVVGIAAAVALAYGVVAVGA